MPIFFITTLVAIINISYWVWIVYSFPDCDRQASSVLDENEPVSLVICSKNDVDIISDLLSHLVNHGWSKSNEIIIVNDFSDNEEGYRELEKEYGVKTMNPSINIIGKKAALLTGIKAAKHNKILITDTDCRPRPGWEKAMAGTLQNSELVLGFSPYVSNKTFLSSWIRFEGFVTAIQYFSFANRGIAYMGVGRNMLLKKSSFESIMLDDLHPEIPSGDDDILVQLANSVSVSISQESFVDTTPKKTWREYFSQKTRHYGISTRYPLHIKLLLSWFSLSQIMFYILVVISFIYNPTLYLLSIIILRWSLTMMLNRHSMMTLESKDLWLFFPLFDILLSIYYFIFGFSFLLPKSKQW